MTESKSPSGPSGRLFNLSGGAAKELLGFLGQNKDPIAVRATVPIGEDISNEVENHLNNKYIYI